MLRCTTERMRIRDLEPGDRDEFLRVHTLSRDHFAAWIDDVSPEQRLERALEQSEADARRQVRLIGESSDGRVAGFFNLTDIVRGVFNSAYASWYVNVEFAGQGFGTEGVAALLDIAFAEPAGLGLHRVQANVIPANAPSIRLAEKVGFRREGLAQRYLRIAGEWQDHIMYAKTIEEHVFKYLRPEAPPTE